MFAILIAVLALVTFWAAWQDSEKTPRDAAGIILFWPVATVLYTVVILACLVRWVWLWSTGYMTFTGRVK